MSSLTVLCIDDQPEVVAAVAKDLEPLGPAVTVVTSSDPVEVPDLVEDLLANDHLPLVLVCDQVMPEVAGVDLLVELHGHQRLGHARSILLTGQASHADTIRAINEARIDRYIEKPWAKDDLVSTVRALLTEAVFDAGIDHLPLMASLDQPTVLKRLRDTGWGG